MYDIRYPGGCGRQCCPFSDGSPRNGLCRCLDEASLADPEHRAALREAVESLRIARRAARDEGLREALVLAQTLNREAYVKYRVNPSDGSAGAFAAWTDDLVRDIAGLLSEVPRG